jgi:uncharacterized protein
MTDKGILHMSENRLRILEPERGVNPAEPGWLGLAMDSYREHVGDRGYPCIFGRRALLGRELWLTWVDPDDPSTLPRDMASFLDQTLDVRGGQPLAVFVKPAAQPRTHDEHDRVFWSLLQYAQDHDDRPWPENVADDPGQEGWEYCFHGAPLFVFAMLPTNVLRRSRNVCDCLVIMFVPKYVFDSIPVGSRGGNAVRKTIRDKLSLWDPVAIHPSLGTIEVMSAHEWEQYVLTDDDSDMHGTCPLTAHGSRRVSAVGPNAAGRSAGGSLG